MDIICASQGIMDNKHPGQGIGDISQAGFEQLFIDMALFCPPDRKELYNSMEPMLEQCRERKLPCTIARAPYLPWNTKREDLNDLLERLAQESIEICGRIGCRYLIVRPLFAGILSEDIWEQNRAFYLGLAQHAKKCGVQILLENQCKDFNGHLVRGLCSDGRQTVRWVDALNEAAGEECFGFCMDVGVCNLCGQNMYDFIMALDNRLKAVILRDCDGNSESALLPFTDRRSR